MTAGRTVGSIERSVYKKTFDYTTAFSKWDSIDYVQRVRA